MEYKEHTYLTSTGAITFAKENNIEIADDDYFRTELRYNQLLKAKNRGEAILDHDGLDEKKYGTVGAVALDSCGNLAAATSTGGITNKRYGRVGDTPIIGAGTYADNDTCAISCTGKGEEFIKLNVAYDISARMKYKMETLHEAAITNIEKRLPEGAGGLIAVDKYGNYTLPFNSIGMFRGIFTSEGVFDVRIWE
jgi:beta-aspartyl-peptidase (threonine type)